MRKRSPTNKITPPLLIIFATLFMLCSANFDCYGMMGESEENPSEFIFLSDEDEAAALDTLFKKDALINDDDETKKSLWLLTRNLKNIEEKYQDITKDFSSELEKQKKEMAEKLQQLRNKLNLNPKGTELGKLYEDIKKRLSFFLKFDNAWNNFMTMAKREKNFEGDLTTDDHSFYKFVHEVITIYFKKKGLELAGENKEAKNVVKEGFEQIEKDNQKLKDSDFGSPQKIQTITVNFWEKVINTASNALFKKQKLEENDSSFLKTWCDEINKKKEAIVAKAPSEPAVLTLSQEIDDLLKKLLFEQTGAAFKKRFDEIDTKMKELEALTGKEDPLTTKISSLKKALERLKDKLIELSRSLKTVRDKIHG